MSYTPTAPLPKLFIGLDIHKRSWRAHFSTDISVGSGKTMPADSVKLLHYVKRHYPDSEVSIAYEAGSCGFMPARAFLSFGWTTFVLNPADIPRPSASSVVKTDKLDATNIAKQLRAGNLQGIHVPELDRECLRSLSRQRSALVKDFRRIKTRIKGLLLYYQIDIPPAFDQAHWSLAFLAWLEDLSWDYAPFLHTLSSMLAQYHFIDQQIKSLSKKLKAYCRKHYHQDYMLLRSVPGIGSLTAAYILAEIGDIKRFTSFKQFASYIGLVPRVYASGEVSRTQGVSPRAKHIIRSMLIESAWVAIRFDPALQAYFRKHAHHNTKMAIFKVAHKLLSRIHAVVKQQVPYQIGLLA